MNMHASIMLSLYCVCLLLEPLAVSSACCPSLSFGRSRLCAGSCGSVLLCGRRALPARATAARATPGSGAGGERGGGGHRGERSVAGAGARIWHVCLTLCDLLFLVAGEVQRMTISGAGGCCARSQPRCLLGARGSRRSVCGLSFAALPTTVLLPACFQLRPCFLLCLVFAFNWGAAYEFSYFQSFSLCCICKPA